MSDSTSGPRTCQFQKVADQFFRDFSRLIAKWPLMFCIFPVCVTVALGSGIYMRRKVFDSPAESDTQVTNYLPDNVDSIQNWRQLSNLFSFEDVTPRGVYDLFKRSYAYVILVDRTVQKNMLIDIHLKVANEIVREVKKLRVHFNDLLDVGWPQLCQKIPGTLAICLEHPFVIYLNTSTSPKQAVQPILHYPAFRFGNVTIDNTLVFGSVISDERGRIQKAQAIRIPFLLQFGESEERRTLNYLWQKEFVNLMKTLRHPTIGIYYSTSISLTDQIDQNGKMLIQYLPVVFCLLVSFSVFCCCATDWVLSQPWLGFCGILTAAQAVVVSVGVLLYSGYPFLQMVFIMPFLILSVSADNAFLVLSCWRNTHPLISIEERVSQAVGGTSVSIMITALTDGLSFAVGSISQFPAVRLFCTYCALAILCAFVYQMTFFTACLALCGRREAANRHCVCFLKVQPKSESTGNKSFLYQIFCSGGYFSAKQKRIPLRLHSHMLTEFFGTKLGDVLCSSVWKVIIVVLYAGYVASAVWGVLHVKIGLQLKNLVPYDSYVAREREITDEHFSAYGSFAFVVITERLEYHDEFTSKRLLELYRSMIDTKYSSEGEFWLNDFSTSVNSSLGSENNFRTSLQNFLSRPEFRKYETDFKFDENRTRILATKFYIRVRNVGQQNLTNMVGELRKRFSRSSFQGFVFDSTFLLVDQEDATIRCVLQDVFIAVGVMILITLLFIPKILCALWIGLSILSINVGVIGYLSLWNVRLDIVSMITTVMSVGLSVDYVAHVTYHYLVVHTSDSKLRMHKTLRHVAVPTIQSAVSTILGVSVLGFVDSYMIQTFVKTVVLVVTLGVLHGLLFLPVALSLFIPADQFLESFSHYDKVREYLATNLDLSKYFGVVPVRNKRMISYFLRPPTPPTPESAADQTEPVLLQTNLQTTNLRPKAASSVASEDSKSEQFTVQTTDELVGAASDTGDLYGFLKSKTSKSWIHRRSYSDVQSVQFVYCAVGLTEEMKRSNVSISQQQLANIVAPKPLPSESAAHFDRLSDSPNLSESSSSARGKPLLNFPPPPLNDAHLYDAPPDARTDPDNQKLRYFGTTVDKEVLDASAVSNFDRRKYLSGIPGCSAPNRRSVTQSEMVRIVLNGNLGSRAALTKSISVDNLVDKSLQSLADSDYFGVVNVDQIKNKTRNKKSEESTNSGIDMKTFKNSNSVIENRRKYSDKTAEDLNSSIL